MVIFAQTKSLIRVFHQHGILRNPRKIRDTVIVERDKGNGDVVLDWTLDDNTIQNIFSIRPKFKKLKEDSTLKREALMQLFWLKSKQKCFFNKKESENLIFKKCFFHPLG